MIANISEIDEDSNLNGVDKYDPFGVKQKSFCEIPSTTNKVIGAHVEIP